MKAKTIENTNPFYGMKATLGVWSTQGKNLATSQVLQSLAEGDTPEKMQVVMSVLTSVGDVPGRDPKGLSNVDNFGFGNREVFRDVVIPAIARSFGKRNTRKYAAIVNQFVGSQFLFDARVRTGKYDKRTKRSPVIATINMPEVWGVDVVGDIACEMIAAGGMDSYLAFKWLNTGRSAKNPRIETKAVLATKGKLIAYISEKMGYDVLEKDGYTDYIGFRKMKSTVTKTLESYLFASGDVKNMDRIEFTQMIEGLPSDARFRVKQRVGKDKEKWTIKGETMWDIYESWEKAKADAQKDVRVLKTELRDAATDAEATSIKEKLVTATKAAKVNIGAKSSRDFIEKMLSGGNIDEITIDAFMDKITLSENILPVVDCSGSMRNNWSGQNKQHIVAYLATLFYRNQRDDLARNIMIQFDGRAHYYQGIDRIDNSRGITRKASVNVRSTPLYNEKLTFMENVTNIYMWLRATANGGMTNVKSVADLLVDMYRKDPSVIDVIQNYPIWMMFSDGDFNNRPGMAASIGEMLKTMETVFGFRPYVILMDVSNGSNKALAFDGVDGVMYLPPSPESVEMLLTNFDPGNVFDIYTPLQAVATTDRYEVIRANNWLS